MPNHIVQTSASGEEISGVIGRIEEALHGEKRGHAIIGCLSIVLVLMYPDITQQQLQDAVRDTSQFICMWLESTTNMGPDQLAKSEMN